MILSTGSGVLLQLLFPVVQRYFKVRFSYFEVQPVQARPRNKKNTLKYPDTVLSAYFKVFVVHINLEMKYLQVLENASGKHFECNTVVLSTRK